MKKESSRNNGLTVFLVIAVAVCTYLIFSGKGFFTVPVSGHPITEYILFVSAGMGLMFFSTAYLDETLLGRILFLQGGYIYVKEVFSSSSSVD